MLRFGAFEADLHSRELRRHGLQIKLQEQPFQILELLLEHPGEIVTREQLRQKLWPADTFVDVDNSLNAGINRLREALGDSTESPRFVETVPRRGYRFVAPVAEVKGADGASADEAATPAVREQQNAVRPNSSQARGSLGKVGLALGISAILVVVASVWAWQEWQVRGSAVRARHVTSLAVLPLENLSGDPSREYFTDGMTDELITDLASIASLRVISRTSTAHYKGTRKTIPEIARELNVDAVVEGSVGLSGNKVRIRAQLVRAVPEEHLWADSYERDLPDVLALQRDVAKAVAGQIKIQLTPEERARLTTARPVNPEAHEAYLKGLYYLEKWSADGTRQAIGYFQQAIEKDPESALGYAGLAQCYTHWSPLPDKESAAKAKAAAMKALDLDETMGEAHTSLAIIKFLNDWDLPGAEREFKRALELNPSIGEAHHHYSHYLTQMGREQESLTESNRFLELDPLSPAPNLHLGWYYLFAGKNDLAIEQLRKTLKMDPNYVEAHSWLGQAYEQTKMYEQAVAERREAVALSGGNSYYKGQLGHTYAISGKREEAQAMIAELKSASPQTSQRAMDIAIVYAGLGDRNKAFEWLDRAYQQRNSYLVQFFRVNPMFQSLHADPRFPDLLLRIGFPQ